MKTTKILLAISTLSLACSGLLFAGCGDDSDTPNPTTDGGGNDGNVVPPSDGGGSDGAKDGGVDAAKPVGPIDRMGRPAIATVLLSAANKDKWNHESTYTVGAKTDYDQDMTGHLIGLDNLDGNNDWGTDAGTHRLQGPLKTDVLVIDTSKSNAVAGKYLDVEGYVLVGAPNTTYGGRTLASDVVDASLKLLVCGPIRAGAQATCPVGDGVDKATKDPATTFPYLADPN